jgi:hypothetical protein
VVFQPAEPRFKGSAQSSPHAPAAGPLANVILQKMLDIEHPLHDLVDEIARALLETGANPLEPEPLLTYDVGDVALLVRVQGPRC